MRKVTAALTTNALENSVIADILAVATREFAQHGFAGARIERILEHTLTSKRMIYYHFGSKEGLYGAVLDHAFQTARLADVGFDPNAGTPEKALLLMVGNAFDAFMQNPAFVRLLAFENLAGAAFIKDSKQVASANRKAVDELQVVISRGQAEGVFRKPVNVMDVYINMVGLCFYHASHYAGYLAAGFEATEHKRIQSASFHAQRKKAIQHTCLGFVKA